MDQNHRTFLLEHKTGAVAHSGRTLFDHLKGVHDLLRDWGNERDVCNAGLFHSIYGTGSFKHVTIADRRPIQQLIGEYAELLVNTFRTKDRPFFDSICNDKMRAHLREIEVANLIEQGAGNRKLFQKFLTMKISDGAKVALIKELALR